MATVAELLAEAKALGVARLDAQLLLAHHLGQSRSWVIAHDTDAVAPTAATAIQQALQQRADAVPLAYLVGQRDFHGLQLQVGPGVLVPRPETEALVDWALEHMPAMPPPTQPRVLDLGTGSGAIALALKASRPDALLHASDASAAALAVATANASRLGLAVDLRLGPWWEPWIGERFDVVVCNPPYIAAGDPHLPALRHEPEMALTPGGDGLGALRQIVASAPMHLRSGGWLLLEHGYDQAQAVAELLLEAGVRTVTTRTDLAGLPRCTGGTWC